MNDDSDLKNIGWPNTTFDQKLKANEDMNNLANESSRAPKVTDLPYTGKLVPGMRLDRGEELSDTYP